MTNFSKYFDNYGLPVGSKEDPGDSLHRVCMLMLGQLWYGDKAYAEFNGPSKLTKYKKHGSFVRHPSPGWWSHNDRLSRDQSTPLVILLSELKLNDTLKKFYMEHMKRFFLFTNTRRNGATLENHGKRKWPGHSTNKDIYNYTPKIPDVAGPEFLAIYIRALDAWYLYPLLFILDLETVIGTIIRVFKKNDTDVLNHLIISRYMIMKYPTPWSYIVRLINKQIPMRKHMEYYFNRIGMIEMVGLWMNKGE